MQLQAYRESESRTHALECSPYMVLNFSTDVMEFFLGLPVVPSRLSDNLDIEAIFELMMYSPMFPDADEVLARQKLPLLHDQVRLLHLHHCCLHSPLLAIETQQAPGILYRFCRMPSKAETVSSFIEAAPPGQVRRMCLGRMRTQADQVGNSSRTYWMVRTPPEAQRTCSRLTNTSRHQSTYD